MRSSNEGVIRCCHGTALSLQPYSNAPSLAPGPTIEQLDLAVDWARSQSHLGRPILVHCAHGHGRSATVLGAILLAEGLAASVEEAEGLMRAVRPRVGFNSRQRAGLEAWFRHRQRMQ